MENMMVFKFCLESTLPGINKAWKENDQDRILDIVVGRANRDVLTGARFHDESYSKNNFYYKNKVKEILKKNKHDTSSTNIIKILHEDNNDHHASFGCIQKLVNMSLKYLYVLQVYGCETGFSIDLNKCDCPLDRRIINGISDKDHQFPSWTKITDQTEYNGIQERIAEVSGKTGLEYDFYNW